MVMVSVISVGNNEELRLIVRQSWRVILVFNSDGDTNVTLMATDCAV